MLSQSTSPTTSKAVPLPGLDPSRRTLLIVDDEEGPRQSLRVVFKDDHNLLIAKDGVSAIELARQHRIDAAVLDIRMIGMSGIELLERLKAVDPNIEVIMLTAYETIETIRKALRLGACDYLNKPFDITTIRAAVAGAMERRSLSDDIRLNNNKLQELQSELQNKKLEEEIVRTRGEIYASVIHDINGPLTVISGFIHVINQRIGEANRLEGEDLELVKDRLKRITRQVSNCIDISRRYLSFLRQKSGEALRISVNQVLADLNELLKVHPSAKDNQLIVRPLAEDVTAQINGTDLIQILLNLSINALQCDPKAHRVEIRAQTLSKPLDLRAFVDGPEERFINREGLSNTPPLLGLSVQDNGPGVASEILPRIFELYFTTKPAGQGTGLGLNIVQRLVKEANGGLHLRTQLGQGAFFTLYLPVRTSA